MKLRQIRESSHMSQVELAEKMAVNQSAVSQWESGQVKPTYGNLIKLCRVLGCTIAELVETDAESA